MKHKRGFSFYFGLICTLFSIGAIVYAIVSGETYVVGKFCILLVVGIVFFVSGSRSGKEADTTQDQKDKSQPGI
ncbi:MAG TPA: hypothetical protein VMW50_11020 [Dehalococcoidia bacterium]|nr:hypothetical protein [Dehalococcoidia bacterium]